MNLIVVFHCWLVDAPKNVANFNSFFKLLYISNPLVFSYKHLFIACDLCIFVPVIRKSQKMQLTK